MRHDLLFLAERRWQVPLRAAIGLWVFFSPSVVPLIAANAAAGGVHDLAIWNDWAAGLAVLIVIAVFAMVFKACEAWGNGALGFWLMASPFALGFDASASLTWNSVICGALLAASASVTLCRDYGLAAKLTNAAAALFLPTSAIVKTWAAKIGPTSHAR